MRDDAPLVAWRLARQEGRPCKRLVVRTTTYPAMDRWLTRSRRMRRRYPATVWIEQDGRPATSLPLTRPRRRGHP